MSNTSDFIIENGILTQYVGAGGDVVIPDGVTQIGAKVFYGNNKITSITVCDGVEHIGESAFGHCRKVEAISLPNTVKTVEKGAFYYCDRLDELQIPENARIGKAMDIVKNCFNLVKLVLPNSMEGPVSLIGCNLIGILACPGIKLDDVSEKLQTAALYGFIYYRDRFTNEDIRESYLAQVMKKEKMMRQMILRYDDAALLQLLVDQGKITAKNIDAEYLEPAVKANAVQCIQYLLNWKNANVKPEDVMAVMQKELNAKPKDPYNAADLKKIWTTEKAEDGTLVLASYKGKELEIKTPPRIGKNQVSKLGTFLFSMYMAGGTENVPKEKPVSRRFELSRIRSIRVAEGVKEIGRYTFLGCTSLEELYLPATVSSIGRNAFQSDGYHGYDCTKVTIYAPAGSYAETYAKENNIPFVAE